MTLPIFVPLAVPPSILIGLFWLGRRYYQDTLATETTQPAAEQRLLWQARGLIFGLGALWTLLVIWRNVGDVRFILALHIGVGVLFWGWVEYILRSAFLAPLRRRFPPNADD